MRSLLLGACAAVAATGGAYGQAALPEIVIEAASPIVPLAPAGQPGEPGPGGPAPIIDTSFFPVTLVTTSEIEMSPAATIGDLVFTRPGVTASTFATGASRPIIRGLDNFRVRIQEDGIGVMDVSSIGEDHGVPIDPLVSKRVEIIRGPATLRWGSQAIGGVVNVTNNRIPDWLPPAGIEVATKGAYTTVDKGYEAAASFDASMGNVATHGDVYRRQANDYAIPGGRQANTWIDAYGGSLGGSVFFHGGYSGIAIATVHSNYGIPGGEAAENGTNIDMRQTKVMGKGEFRPQAPMIDAVRYWYGVSDYIHDERVLERGNEVIKATFKNREQEARTEIQFAPFASMFGAVTSALGFQFGHQALGTSGEAGSLLAPTDTLRFAGYLFNEIALTETVKLQVAGRIENVRTDGTAGIFPPDLLPPPEEPALVGVKRSFLPMSVSAGLLKSLPFGMVASLTAQYVERAPDVLELFAKGPHEATGTFEIGDPNLQKEKAASVEIGLRRARGQFRFEASAFYTQYQGFIYKRLTGIECGEDFATCGIEDELQQVVFDQRNANFTGAEVAGAYDVGPLANGTFGVDGRYDVLRARFDDGSPVPRMPPQRIGGGVYWRSDAWYARLGLLHAFAQPGAGAQETPTAAYNLLKAEISYSKKWQTDGFGPSEVMLGITGTNLLNDVVRNSASFNKDEVMLPGRNIRFFARVKF